MKAEETMPEEASSKPENKAGDTGTSTFKAITSQDELNAVLGDRLARERAKFADYDALKAKAEQFDALQSQQQQAESDAVAGLRAEIDQLKSSLAEKDREVVRVRVAGEKNVPADYVTGETEAEMAAAADKFLQHAQAVAGATGRFGVVPLQGTGGKATVLNGRERAQAHLEQNKI